MRVHYFEGRHRPVCGTKLRARKRDPSALTSAPEKVTCPDCREKVRPYTYRVAPVNPPPDAQLDEVSIVAGDPIPLEMVAPSWWQKVLRWLG